MTNEEKARKIAESCSVMPPTPITQSDVLAMTTNAALQAMKWKDEERKELWRITRNHYQEWAIEQITAFAQHLNKCGAFREDLCMDFEHEAQTFIEYQNK